MIKLNNDQKKYLQKRVKEIEDKILAAMKEKESAAHDIVAKKHGDAFKAWITAYQFPQEILESFKNELINRCAGAHISSSYDTHGVYRSQGNVYLYHNVDLCKLLFELDAEAEKRTVSYREEDEKINQTFGPLRDKLRRTTQRINDQVVFGDSYDDVLEMLDNLEKDYKFEGDNVNADFAELRTFLETIGVKKPEACHCGKGCDKPAAKPAPRKTVRRK